MTTITFDTLAFVKKLKSAGISEPQAEAMSDAFKEAQQASIDGLATKNNLKELELAVKTEIKEVELRINAKIDKLLFDIKVFFIIMLCAMVILNPKALDVISKILGTVK
ncbi:MAG: DUF1640 domain-containing protein [Nitrospirae bacterium]|nr:DUF1640 domain-containing protein [Nitrospirota bacterium]MBF0540525.1 DUF1640 domain-containing protein [Nitrospirota bacterium]